MEIGELKVVLKKLIGRDTEAFKKVLDGGPDLLAKLSDTAKKAFEEINKRDFGVPKEHIRQLTSAYLGEELPAMRDTSKWIFTGCGFICVKMLVQPAIAGNERFKVGETLARLPGFAYDGQNYYVEALIGQNGEATSPSTFVREQFKFAEKEEIEKYIDALPEKTLNRIRTSIVFVPE